MISSLIRKIKKPVNDYSIRSYEPILREDSNGRQYMVCGTGYLTTFLWNIKGDQEIAKEIINSSQDPPTRAYYIIKNKFMPLEDRLTDFGDFIEKAKKINKVLGKGINDTWYLIEKSLEESLKKKKEADEIVDTLFKKPHPGSEPGELPYHPVAEFYPQKEHLQRIEQFSNQQIPVLGLELYAASYLLTRLDPRKMKEVAKKVREYNADLAKISRDKIELYSLNSDRTKLKKIGELAVPKIQFIIPLNIHFPDYRKI